jgi:hypothetical protein
MTNLPLVRLPLKLLTLVVLLSCLWFFSGSAANPQKTDEPRSLQVKARQLDPVGGTLPVELTCEDAKLMGRGRIKELKCVIKNNSFAPMVAGILHVSIIIDANGREESVSGYHTFDTFLHPDFREDHKNNLIQPGMVYRFNVSPSDYGDATVKEIEAEVDYIEFLDRPSVGPNHVGSRRISDIREGAAKYKNWLAERYKRKAASVMEIAEILDNENIDSNEIGLKNSDQRSGASMYRKYARRTYNSKGPQEFLRRLNGDR